MKLRTLFMAMLIATVAVSFAMAQDAEVKKVDTDVKIGAKLWGSFDVNINDGSMMQTNFSLGRAYLTASKNLNETFSMKMILEGKGDMVVGKAMGYGMFVKQIEVKGQTALGSLNVYGKFGIIDTPHTAYMAGLNGDFRINSDYIIAKSGIEKGYDAGAGFGAKYEKLIDFYATVTHGGGYTSMGDNSTDYKYNVATRLTIMPVEGIYVNLEYQRNDLDNNDDAVPASPSVGGVDSYLLGGLAYKSGAYKAGFNVAYLMSEEQNAATLGIDKDMLIDVWANANLKDAAGMPIMVYLGFTYKKDDAGADDTYGIDATVGYKFDGGVEADLQFTYAKVKNIDAVKTIKVLAAASF